MISNIEIYNAISPKDSTLSFPDFKLGNLKLALHLGITEEIGSLLVSPDYAKQLLLKQRSHLNSGRVPLYVCQCCADLGCGATTVFIEETEDTFIWSKFGRESNWEEGLFQTEYMKRTGPFIFNKEKYISTINPYASSK